MKAHKDDPLCCGQRAARWKPAYHARSDVLQGDGTTQSCRWQGTTFDHQPCRVGNCFRLRSAAAHDREQSKEVLLTFHQDHASPRLAQSLIRTMGACAPLSVLLVSTDVPPSCCSLRTVVLPAKQDRHLDAGTPLRSRLPTALCPFKHTAPRCTPQAASAHERPVSPARAGMV